MDVVFRSSGWHMQNRDFAPYVAVGLRMQCVHTLVFPIPSLKYFQIHWKGTLILLQTLHICILPHRFLFFPSFSFLAPIWSSLTPLSLEVTLVLRIFLTVWSIYENSFLKIATVCMS